MSECRTCGEPIVWVMTENGRRMPLNPDPNPAGNIIFVEDADGHPVTHQLHRGEDPGDADRFVPHFATCSREACACVTGTDAGEPALEDVTVAGSDDVLVQAVDRLVQVLDYHLARIFDQLQGISSRIGDLRAEGRR